MCGEAVGRGLPHFTFDLWDPFAKGIVMLWVGISSAGKLVWWLLWEPECQATFLIQLLFPFSPTWRQCCISRRQHTSPPCTHRLSAPSYPKHGLTGLFRILKSHGAYLRSFRTAIWKRLQMDSTIHNRRRCLHDECDALPLKRIRRLFTIMRQRCFFPVSTQLRCSTFLPVPLLIRNFNSICILWLFL